MKFKILLLFLLIIPIVSANIIINPSSPSIETYKDTTKYFRLNITNNNSFKIYNLTFSNVTHLTIPPINELEPNATAEITYSARTNAVFNTAFVSTIQYIFKTIYNESPITYEMNITDSSFSPSELTIVENDSITFRNTRSRMAEIRDLSTGFSQLDLNMTEWQTRQYPIVAEYQFYERIDGFTGKIHIKQKSMESFTHDSSKDVVVAFQINSILDPSSFQLNPLTFNFTANNNQTQNGVLEVKNLENIPLYEVVLNDSRGWIQFQTNNFTLNGLENKLVTFNITPYVTQTSQTNVSLQVDINAKAKNGGNATKPIFILINYKNFDTVTANGTTYVLQVLGINETIDACVQHFGESGFESCQKLKDKFQNNITVIKEVEAQHQITESKLLEIEKSASEVGGIATRVENKVNINIDFINKLIEFVNQSESSRRAFELNVSARQTQYEVDLKEHKKNDRTILWAVIIIAVLILIIALIYEFKVFEIRKKTGQV